MKVKNINKRLAFLSLIFVLTFISSALIAYIAPGTSSAAPPDSITINSRNSGIPAAECRFVMASDAGYVNYRPNTIVRPTSTGFDFLDTINANPSLRTDHQEVENIYERRQVLTYIYMAPVTPSSDGNNGRTCNHGGILFSRPSTPQNFYGWINDSAVLSQPVFTPPANSTPARLTIGSTSAIRSSLGYNITEAPGNPGLFANPAFGAGSGPTIGFCADAGIALSYCMGARVLNFNTITYRGETYRLRQWAGTGIGRDFMFYDLVDTPILLRQPLETSSTSNCRPHFTLKVNPPDEIADLNVDGDGGAGERADFMRAIGNLPTNPRLGYVDYSSLCAIEADTTVTVLDFGNLSTMFFLNQREPRVGFDVGSPGTNERAMFSGDSSFRVSSDNPLVYDAVEFTRCPGIFPSIEFTEDPTTTNSPALAATWTTVTDLGGCITSTAAVRVRIVPSTSTETVESVTAPIAAANTAALEAAGEPTKTCSSEGGLLGWLLCPGLLLLDQTTQFLEDELRGFLFVDPEQFDTGGDIYTAWSTFRSIATVIIVIVALMMIFSQAMGAGVFDNYSVKKLLPRLLMAGIGIQLSWFLLVQLVNVFNVLGDGIGGLIGSPFGIDPDTSIGEKLNELTGHASTGDFFTGLVVAGTVGAVIIGSIVPIAIGAVTALFIGLITLVVRNMIILLAVVLAPVAIAMSVLPGTQKTAKLWWESLEKALLMYPIVIALLMSGKIVATLLFAAAAPTGGSGIRMVYVIAGIIAWYAPFFFLPKMLQAGGSALGKITGLAGDKSKGFFDRARNLNDTRKKNRKEYARNSAFDPNSKQWWSRGSKNPLKYAGKAAKATSRTGAYLEGGTLGISGYTASKMGRDQQRAKSGEANAQTDAYKEYAKKIKDMSPTDIAEYKAKGGKGSILLDQAEIKVSQAHVNARAFDLQAAKAEMKLKEAEIEVGQAAAAMKDQLGAAGIVDDTALTAHFASAKTDAQRTAVLNQLAVLGKDQVVRDLKSANTGVIPISAGGDGIRQHEDLFAEVQNSSSWQGAFKDKAPDLTKGGSAFNDVKSDSMVNWSEGTMQAAVKRLEEKRAAATISGSATDIAEADAAWSRFGQSVTQIVNDPKLSGRMSGAALGVLGDPATRTIVGNGLNTAGVLSHMANVNRVQRDGTIT